MLMIWLGFAMLAISALDALLMCGGIPSPF
jgi:hypothetical protein